MRSGNNTDCEVSMTDQLKKHIDMEYQEWGKK